LKSPITLTRCAFGAHTAKCTPVTLPRSAVRAQLLPGAIVRALAEEMQIEVAQQLTELIRVLYLALCIYPRESEAVRRSG
jgi:hypothetical protein